MTTINILNQPTFDLTVWTIIGVNPIDKIIFCQSSQIFKFDKCKGCIMPRSRLLRLDKVESGLVENVISAAIDAGFCGKLFWKIKLTNQGQNFFDKLAEENLPATVESLVKTAFQVMIKDSVQIDLNPFSNNYYKGTNQTELEPNIIFTQYP